jgi:acetyltransferase
LRENSTMIAMCRELGFDVKNDPRDAAVVTVTLDLARPPRPRAAPAEAVSQPQ